MAWCRDAVARRGVVVVVVLWRRAVVPWHGAIVPLRRGMVTGVIVAPWREITALHGMVLW